MYKLALCYPSNSKENKGIEFLYGPLSLAYIARHTPENYMMSLHDEYVGETIDAQKIDADLVAISALTPGISRAYQIGDQLRKRGIKCVIGGNHVTALPDEALEHFDSVIIGEGENPWEELLKDFEKGNISDKYYGPMNVPLDTLGTPDRRFIHKNYKYPSVNTSRGCPYNCSFCYLSVYKDRKYRIIPHKTILEDLDSLRDEFVVLITDENFMGYTEENFEDRKTLLKEMIRQKFHFVWGCQTTVKVAENPEMMELMYRAGCRGIFIGFESSNMEDLIKMHKKQNVGIDFQKVVEKIHEHKIAVIASCILGMDNQQNDYHLLLIKELKSYKVDYVRVYLMTAWPGTPLYDQLKAENRLSSLYDKVRFDIPSTIFKHYTPEEIIIARNKILKSFYSALYTLRVIFRWIFSDTTLIPLFIKLSVKNRIAERIRIKRAVTFLKN